MPEKTRAASELLCRNTNNKAVERRANFDLAAQPAAIADVEREIEHIFFHLGGLTRCRLPSIIDVNMARRAGTRTAALRLDALDVIQLGGFHDG